MLFNFQAYIQELRENEEKKEVIAKYEKFYGIIQGDVKDQLWYTEYASKFETVPYAIPEELDNEFDWNFLMQLCASTFSSDFVLDTKSKPLELNIIPINQTDTIIIKHISELWSFQILRLYEIYIEEAMSLQILIKEDEKEAEAIINQRRIKFENWNKKISTVKSEMELDNILNDL